MGAVIALLVGLLGCPEPQPSFGCCGTDRGEPSYPVDDPTWKIREPQRQTVRAAIAAGALPGDVDVDAAARSADRHGRSRWFWKDIEASAEAYAQVAALALEAGREPMLAAVPFLLTRYRLDLQSRDCANGPWQLAATDPRVIVGPCRLLDSAQPWDREFDRVPVDPVLGCRIRQCEPDERLELEASTRAVLSGTDFPADRGVAAGVHLLALCLLRARPEPPPFAAGAVGAYCADVRLP